MSPLPEHLQDNTLLVFNLLSAWQKIPRPKSPEHTSAGASCHDGSSHAVVQERLSLLNKWLSISKWNVFENISIMFFILGRLRSVSAAQQHHPVVKSFPHENSPLHLVELHQEKCNRKCLWAAQCRKFLIRRKWTSTEQVTTQWGNSENFWPKATKVTQEVKGPSSPTQLLTRSKQELSQ